MNPSLPNEMPGVPTPPVGTPLVQSPPRRTGRGLVLGLLLGLVLGAGGVTLAWVLNGDGGPDQQDAAAACALLVRLDHTKVTDEGPDGLVALNRWGGAQVLSAAAAEQDGRYAPLAEAVKTSLEAYRTTFDPSEPRVGAELQRARSLCTEL